MKNLFKRIKDKRDDTGLNQAEVAKKVGISLRTYSRWESGEIEPTLSQIEILAIVLQTTKEYLLNIEVEPSSLSEAKIQSMILKVLNGIVPDKPADPVKLKSEIMAVVNATRKEELPDLLAAIKSFKNK